jgi:hypothetical protein
MLRTDTREHTELADDDEAAAAVTAEAATPDASAAFRELLFQRCLWCGTPAYRRSFERERSEGSGVVVRRYGHVPHNTWFVAMDEGFNLLCQVTGSAPVAVAVGARVSVVRSVVPLGQGLPLVELSRPAPVLERWW